MTEVKSCPFCGSNPEIMTSPDGFTSIGCLKCNPVFGVMVQRRTRKEAVELWNARADDRSEAAAYWQRLYEQTVAENARLEAALRAALQNALGNWGERGDV